MTFKKRVEGFVVSRYFLAVPLFISLLAVLNPARRLTDQSYDIVQAGTRWLNGSILYVQSWSTHSPQALTFGYLYGRYVHGTGTLVDILLFTVVCALLYGIAKLLLQNNILARNALLLLASTTVFVPSVWQSGLTDQKLGLLFLAAYIYFYILWKNSGPAMWLFGKTSKNWRFILLSGIALSMLVWTTWIYLFLALPIIIDFVVSQRKNAQTAIRWATFLVVPFLLETWVWLSYLSSHRLLKPYAHAQLISFMQNVHVARLGVQLPLLVIVVIVLLAVLVNADKRNFSANKPLWVWSLFAVILFALWPGWLVTQCLVALPLLVFIFNKHSVAILRPWILIASSIVVIILCLPLRLVDSQQSRVQRDQANVAIAYVVQRLVDAQDVIYYGNGSGVYSESGFSNPSRFGDLSVLSFDTPTLDMESDFRGDVEAITPPFAIVATSDELKAPSTPRLDQYFSKHYEKVADLDGYSILKRK